MSRSVTARLGPELVGRRVVVRRRLPGGQLSDLLGELVRWHEDSLCVATSHGEVTVALADVVAGKAVPPPPARRVARAQEIDWAALEDIAADGWRPLELEWLGDPGRGWRLRAAQGFTGRANSALALGDPGSDLESAIAAVVRWYHARGLQAQICVPWPLADREPPVDRVLGQADWQHHNPTLVCTSELRAAAELTGRAVTPDPLTLAITDQPDAGWLSVYRYRGQDLPPVATRLLLSAPAQAFFSIQDPSVVGNPTVAVARAASSRGWTGLTAMDVQAEYRRRGLGRALLAAVVQWGLERGDRSGYLQVAEPNLGAQALYRAAGFVPHHGYHYRLGPSAPASDR